MNNSHTIPVRKCKLKQAPRNNDDSREEAMRERERERATQRSYTTFPAPQSSLLEQALASTNACVCKAETARRGHGGIKPDGLFTQQDSARNRGALSQRAQEMAIFSTSSGQGKREHVPGVCAAKVRRALESSHSGIC